MRKVILLVIVLILNGCVSKRLDTRNIEEISGIVVEFAPVIGGAR